MGERLTHECGLAFVRLRKPLHYYQEVHGDAAWGLRKTYLLMQKQYNRGQDGAGLGVVKFDMPPGEQFLLRIRSDRHNAIERVFDVISADTEVLEHEPLTLDNERSLKCRCEFLGEVYIGHLRYGTHSGNAIANCHPLIRKTNVASRTLALAGNFNMTNAPQLFQQLLEYGLSPAGDNDTQVILEKISHFLDQEHEHLARAMGPESLQGLEGRALAEAVSRDLDVGRVLRRAAQYWDGGFVFAGLIGNGDAFVCRDPAGIRPGFVLVTDEVVAAASERGALANVFDVDPDEISPIEPGHAVVVKRGGEVQDVAFTDPMPLRQCTFERIYFSRGNDPEIYKQRKSLGAALGPRILEVLGEDLDRSVFSYIPNTAETAYLGLLETIGGTLRQRAADVVWDKIQSGSVEASDLAALTSVRVRAELIAHKDQRLRTFITHDSARRDLVGHIYDITRGLVGEDDTLVVLDDSIVRGTTLRESIITILSRLNPHRIVVASSAPPIMYPDCYGIDMSQLGRFIAFEAAVALLHDRGDIRVLDDVEERCLEQADRDPSKMVNHVAAIYERNTLAELSAKIAELVRPADLPWKGELDIIYQDIDGLRSAMAGYTGDWYFTGDYPTPGGYAVLNRAFLNWRRGKREERAY